MLHKKENKPRDIKSDKVKIRTVKMIFLFINLSLSFQPCGVPWNDNPRDGQMTSRLCVPYLFLLL